MPINVLVCDDHDFLRKGIISELSKYQDIYVIGEAINGDDALAKISECMPDVLLLDLNMPKVSGIEVLETIKSSRINIKTIVLSMDDSDKTIIHCIDAGANGFISKDEPGHGIYTAIKSVIENGCYFSENANKSVLKSLVFTKNTANSALKNKIEFSEREIKVIEGLSQGMTASEIGYSLSYSPRTIEGIRQELMSRVGAKNGASLVFFAFKNGYIK